MSRSATIGAASKRTWRRNGKALAAQTLHATGSLSALVQLRLKGRAVVLTYHRVLADDGRHQSWSHPGMVVRRETFAAHMAMLAGHFKMLTVEAFIAHLEAAAPFDRPSCLVTFDDGWIDTLEEAWPILERHRVPAVVFLPVSRVGSERAFWQESLAAGLYLAWEQSRNAADVRARYERLLPAVAAPVLGAAAEDVRDVIHDRVQALKRERARDPWSLVARLEMEHGPAKASGVDRLMTWGEIRRLAERGLAFGGHGASHRILTSLPQDDVRTEVQSSRDDIDRELGCPPAAFSYPNGDWNAEVAEAVQRTGFRVAFSTKAGRVSMRSKRYSVPRLNVSERSAATPALLLARIAGIF